MDVRIINHFQSNSDTYGWNDCMAKQAELSLRLIKRIINNFMFELLINST